jgi:excisionase family DNA binding protein
MLTPAEAREVLHIGRNQLYTAIRQGQIPSVRFGSVIRIPVPALLRLLGDEPTAVTEGGATTPPEPTGSGPRRTVG